MSLKTAFLVNYDNYSKIYNNKELIEAYNPFIVQTPALGFKSFKKSTKIGAYREIIIKNGKLASFQVKYV